MEKRVIEVASTSRVDELEDEIQLLINIIQPNPRYQPIITDEACALDCSSASSETIRARLECYFGKLPFKLTTPLCEVVRIFREIDPDWPENI
jgi:hypothetical protein